MNPRVWSALVDRHPWLARAMLVACSLSLLATSYDDDDDDGGSVAFTRTSTAPACTLDAETPACRFLVTIRHEVPDPGEPFFTFLASATTRGTIAASGVTGDAPFVAVRVASDDQPGVNELNALTQFSVDRALAFFGGCQPASANTPCIAEFEVSFSRSDSGARGGIVQVNWELGLEARSQSEVEPNAGGALPWTVEYVSQ